MNKVDAIVIGGGQSGPFLAARHVGEGKEVVIIEKDKLGGTCVNRGCTPTKTLRKSARVAHMARRAGEFGVKTGPVEVDFAAAMNRMQTRVDNSRGGLEGWLSNLDGLTISYGHGRLAGRHEGDFRVEVSNGDVFVAPTVYLNTGTRPFVPPIPGIDAPRVLTSTGLLALRERPARLMVLGGSYIGLELGQIFSRLGSEVIVVETGPRLAGREDLDISNDIEAMLVNEGLDIRLGTGVNQIEALDDGVRVTLSDGDVVEVDYMLVATGRRPNTEELGLDTVGLNTDPRGYIPTDGELRTEVAGIYALGDINKRGAFTHTSYHDQQIVWANLHGESRSADDRTMAYAMFTDPPLGHVGIHEADATRLVEGGRDISVASIAMKDVSRAKEESETTGRIKIWIDEDKGQILGASMLGMNADEIIQSLSLVMAAGGTIHDIFWALPVHPTITEFFPTILSRRKPLTAG